MKQMCETEIPVNDKYDAASLTSGIILCILLAKRDLRNSVLPLFEKKYYNIAQDARKLSLTFKEIGFSDPVSVFKCLVEFFTYYDLWDVQSIQFTGKDIFSPEDAARLIQSNNHSLSTII